MKVHTQKGFLFWSCSLFSWIRGGSINILPWTVFSNGWAQKKVSLLVCWHHCFERMMECVLFFLGGANVFAKIELHWKVGLPSMFHGFFPTISWNQWWGAFSIFLVVLILNLFFEVVSKRWAPLNKDFFAVLFLGLETRFTINWKFVPVSRCARLKQYNFFCSFDIHVASSCGNIIPTS